MNSVTYHLHTTKIESNSVYKYPFIIKSINITIMKDNYL